MVQDEVTWVLETIAENWPDTRGSYGGGYGGVYGVEVTLWPGETGSYGDGYGTDYGTDVGSVVRVNRDEPEILETGERTRSFELSRASTISASLASRPTSPLGTEYDVEVESSSTSASRG